MGDLSKIANIPATGDEVARRYRYQYLYTVLLAIKMYSKEVNFERLFCELAEDVLAVTPEKKFVGIQIKTMEQKGKLFEFNDESITESVCKFVTLDHGFRNLFQKFVLVVNVDFKNGKDLQKIIDAAKEKNTEKFDDFITKIQSKTKVEKSKILKTLQKIEIHRGPGIDDMESKVAEYVRKLPDCSTLLKWQTDNIFSQLEKIISEKSSKVIHDSIKDYLPFVKDGKKKQRQIELESKEITLDIVEQIIKSINPIYLKSDVSSSLALNQWNSKVMEKKMIAGGIHEMEIEIIQKLSYSAQVSFFEKYNETNGNSKEISKELDHLEIILTNEAAEAKSETRNGQSSYGNEMLKSIENRLRALVRDRPHDVFGTRYELLKGAVGILTGDCKIWFSNHSREELN